MSGSLTTSAEPSEDGTTKTPSSATSSEFSSQRASTPSQEPSQVHGQSDLSQSSGSDNAFGDGSGTNSTTGSNGSGSSGTGGDVVPNPSQLDRFLNENMFEEGNMHGRLLQGPSALTTDDDALAEFFEARAADALRQLGAGFN